MKSFLERLFGKGDRHVPANDPEDVLEDVRAQIRRDVAAAFDEPAVILENAVDVFDGELDRELLMSRARQYLDEELAAHAAEQSSWPVTTDCDRLDSAFAALEASGIVCRHNFTCCGTCGSSEIWGEIDAVKANGGPARGYAFYHMQDLERAVEGDGIFLNYGACDDGEGPALAVANAIVAEMRRQGLRADWDGSWDKRIGVSLDWKRRRTA